MKKTVIAILTISMVLIMSGCVYSNNYDKNGNEMNKEQVDKVIAETKDTIIRKENSDDLKANNLYSPFSAQKTDSDYQIKGTIYLSSERDLVNVQANSEAEITLAGRLKKTEGEIKLLYEDTDGNTTTLIDSEDNYEKT